LGVSRTVTIESPFYRVVSDPKDLTLITDGR
jgi:hypothetical protein